MRRIFRPIKEGFIGFFRHFSVSLSSVAVVTFTMLFLGLILLITDNINTTTQKIETEIEIWTSVKREYEDQVEEIHATLESLNDVHQVTYLSKEEELELYISQQDSDVYDYLRDDNPMLDAFIIQVNSGEVLTQVVNQLENYDWPSEIRDGGEGTTLLISTLETMRVGGDRPSRCLTHFGHLLNFQHD